MSAENTLSCVVVDDEPLARDGLLGYIAELDFLEAVGAAASPLELAKLLAGRSVDLVFLDIEMPRLNGMDWLRSRPGRGLDSPAVILTTAYPGHALEGFELDVVDYLLKPITFGRFARAVDKVRRAGPPSAADERSGRPESIYIKCEQRYKRIELREILFVEALQNYVTVHTDGGRYVTHLSLKAVEGYLDETAFARVHKSYIVALGRIDAVEPDGIRIGEHLIPLSRSFREPLLERVVRGRLWRRS